jgi:hypothetical protein
MKTSFHRVSVLAALLGLGLVSVAAPTSKEGQTPEPGHLRVGGPNGGRLLETEPRAEFLIEKDRSVTIRFLSHDLKPVAIGEQVVTFTAEPAAGKTRIELKREGEAFKSQIPLPAGEGYNLVVQIRSKPGVKPQNFRFKLDLSPCGECKRQEYACICDH